MIGPFAANLRFIQHLDSDTYQNHGCHAGSIRQRFRGLSAISTSSAAPRCTFPGGVASSAASLGATPVPYGVSFRHGTLMWHMLDKQACLKIVIKLEVLNQALTKTCGGRLIDWLPDTLRR